MNTRVLPALNILIIDNDPKNLVLLTTIFEEKMYSAATSNGKTALSAAKTLLPEVILLASNLAKTSGFDLCRHRKTDQDMRNIPVIILTEHEKSAIRKRVEAASHQGSTQSFQ